MKPYQINILPRPVLGDLEQIDDSQESGFDSQLVVDVLDRNLLDRIDLDQAVFHGITLAHRYLRPLPDPHTDSNGSGPHTLPKPLGEHHF